MRRSFRVFFVLTEERICYHGHKPIERNTRYPCKGKGRQLQTDKLLAGVVMLSIMGLSVGFVLNRVERHLLRWR
jgi:hypothetical protein